MEFPIRSMKFEERLIDYFGATASSKSGREPIQFFIRIWFFTTAILLSYSVSVHVFFEPKIFIAIGYLMTFIHALSPFVLKFTRSINWGATCIAGSALGFQVTFMFHTGGNHSSSPIWLAAYPILLGILGGSPMLYAGLGASLGVLAGFEIMAYNEALPTSLLVAPFDYYMLLSSYVGINILVALVTNLFLKMNAYRLQKIEEERYQADTITRILSHDIAAPLMVAEGAIDVLSTLPPDKVKRREKMFYLLNQSIDQARDILDRTRGWYLGVMDQYVVNNIALGCDDVSEYIHDSYASLIEKKGIQIEIHNNCPDDLAIHTDKGLFLGQILNNIMTNAIKFSPENEKVIIEFNPKDRCLIISIKDFGLGIPEEHQKTLLSPKTSVSSHGTMGEKGSGLGMSIVYSVIKSLNGQIYFETNSNPEKGSTGTTFFIVMPSIEKCLEKVA